MKRIMSFSVYSHEVIKESVSNLNDIINDCKDILIDLGDNKITYKVNGVSLKFNDEISIEIGDDGGVTSLSNMDLPFEHLISYLESMGFILDGNGSFYENSNWEYYERCPNCFSDNIRVNDDVFTCNKCKLSGDSDDFITPEWPLDKSELFYSIKMNYKFDFMSLVFYRVKK